jgi:mannose-6-phosphate isomerase-like protein (cupin superfamily)
MKYGAWDIGGEVVKQDERYIVKDNTELNNLIVSSTRLNPNKYTSGHKHKGQEEVYMFINGSGEMEIDNDRFNVSAGDTVLIKDGVFHRVFNTTQSELYFICVFDGRRNH